MSRLATTLAVVLHGVLFATLPAGAELTPQEQRGKAIYFEGTSVSGVEITALIGDMGTEVPASVMPCSSCHGRDGRGRPEGGVYPSNLTWPALTKPYGVEHSGGRRHQPYDESSLKLAIAMGVDPSGNRLHVAMPLYRLSHQDMGDLIAYLRRLGEDPDPGLTDDAVVLATLLPREGPLAPLGAAIEAVLEAYINDVNQQGGIYQRRLELRVEPSPLQADERAAAVRRLLESEKVFALVSVFLPGAEAEVVDVVDELETPLVGPFTLRPEVDFFAPNPHVFYLLPGLEDLARSLVGFVEEKPARAAIVASADPGMDAAAQAIARAASELVLQRVSPSLYGFGVRSMAVVPVSAVGAETSERA